MIKAFENYEIWFVTGAQLLYGGDAVVQVDGHSSAMVEGMNASGILPVKVVYRQEMCWCDHLDAHFLSCKDVDTRNAEAPQASPSFPHSVQRGDSLGDYGYGLYEPQPECPRRP